MGEVYTAKYSPAHRSIGLPIMMRVNAMGIAYYMTAEDATELSRELMRAVAECKKHEDPLFIRARVANEGASE